MPLRQNATPSLGEGDWVFVEEQWWRTPFDSVSWSYPLETKQEATAPTCNIVYAKPPYNHHSHSESPPADAMSLSSATMASVEGDVRAYEDDGRAGTGMEMELSSELIGVKGAVDILLPYEINVGFFYATQSHSPADSEFPPSDFKARRLNVSDEELVHGRAYWDDIVQKVTGGLVLDERFGEDEDSPTGSWTSDFSPLTSSTGLHSSTSTLSSIDLSNLDLPLTPRVTTNEDVAVHDSSSNIASPQFHLSSRLNATASTFVPSFHSTKPVDSSSDPSLPSLNNFTFPSIDRPTSVKITKDDQGFVTEVEVEAETTSSKPSSAPQSRSSSALLPAFLHEPTRRKAPASKTRAIVDKLRSSASNQSSRSDWTIVDGSDNRTKSASITPARSPNFDITDFMTPRTSMSENGGDGERDTDGASSLEPDEEGWFTCGSGERDEPSHGNEAQDASEPTTEAFTSDKAKRAQALFLALNRHRGSTSPDGKTTNSTSSGVCDENMAARAESAAAALKHLSISSIFQKRAESRGSSSSPNPSSKKQSKRSTPTTQPPRPLSISIPTPQHHAFTPAIPSFPYATVPSQFPVPTNVALLPYMTTHHPYIPSMQPLPNHYLQVQMQMQLQLQVQGFVPGPPTLRPTSVGDWIVPSRVQPGGVNSKAGLNVPHVSSAPTLDHPIW
ncbi:hypothetical protein PLEOSDRAFT_1112980 [Pleurotus ostreatus PC15]|uniref:Uncharacterized protein n=1 Tax=Pleurotus ostreatus (strain PC15) TaxID=1137138 RepID=A0A067NK06_PLEO1|nr:hypothetical protein PLEOSDRAFT_1112980 [Pleurotus ostreatus PC15]